MEEKITFGKYILQKRKQAGLSQKGLAEKLYVTESAVSKWERGISYPDISLVASLCKELDISEHELITASDDFHQHEIEKQAKSFRTVVKTYSWIFYILYGISLAACFIVNIAVSHKLSWFFIVLAGVLVAFSLTNVPLLVTKHRGGITLAAFYLSLNLLLLVCAIFTGGNWFGVVFISILFGFTIAFLPFMLCKIPLPEPLTGHIALLSVGIDTILLLLLVIVSCIYANSAGAILPVAIPVAGFGVILPWVYVVVIRYTRCNGLFKTAICLAASGIYTFFVNSILNMLIDHKPFQMPQWYLTDWRLDNINGNTTFLILLICMLLALLFTIGGIALTVRGGRKTEERD